MLESWWGYVISIHLMFLLIVVNCKLNHAGLAISIHLMFLLIPFRRSFIAPYSHFNTSHVSINLAKTTGMDTASSYFNTSHVSINPLLMAMNVLLLSYFNTSHVSINRRWRNRPLSIFRISIHLMFLLIGKFAPKGSGSYMHFNTSHVSINHEFADGIQCRALISIHLRFLLIMVSPLFLCKN